MSSALSIYCWTRPDGVRSATSESDKEGKTKRSTRLFGSFGGSSPAPPSNATMAGSNDPKSLISSPLEAGASKMGGNKSDASPQIKQQSSATALSGSKSTPGTPKRQGSRPISAAASPQTKSSAVSAPVEGQDIMKKIGTPELTGWLRKKSERYNTWKMRYMVLKGRHLYAMKSATVS